MVKHATWDKDELEKPLGAHRLAERLITRPLRAKATAIRSGEEPAVLPTAPPAPVQEVERRSGLRHVLFLEPVRYIGHGGQPVVHAAWTARVPAVVAEAAIEQGLALDADTAEAGGKMKDIMERRRRRGPVPAVSVEDTTDLGVNLDEEFQPLKNAGAA